MTSSIITCLAWVPQGAAKDKPEKVQIDKADIDGLLNKSKTTRKASRRSDQGASGGDDIVQSDVTMDADNDLAEYNLDDYDSSDSDSGNVLGRNVAESLAVYSDNRDDPYVTLMEDQEDIDELEDFTIHPTDNLIVAGRAEEDTSCLEVYVYNEDDGVLYVHHDIILPSFPLSAEWLTFNPNDSAPGNFVAVGYMTPVIDVWNLDIVDCLEPEFTLGKQGEKAKKKSSKPIEGHIDAVLDIAWNRLVTQGLASASADSTIALWDMKQQKVMSSLSHHTDKVQTVTWHPFEAQSLASGSFDMSVKVYDCRSPHDSFKSWSLEGEVERVVWNYFQPFHLLASTDRGFVYCVDVRSDKPVFTLKAHDDTVTALGLSTGVPSCMVTASADHFYKVWDIKDNKPSLIVAKDPKMGTINSIKCSPNSPFVFALGGEKDGMRLVDITSHAPVHRQFSKRRSVHPAQKPTLEADQPTTSRTDQPEASHDYVAVETCKRGDSHKKRTKKKKKQLAT